MVRIVLADDHKILREGLRSLLEDEEDFDVVAEADDGRQAIDLVEELKPDVIIMDIGMPNLNGIEATRYIKSGFPETRVLALSMHANERFVAEMLRAGADGYLLKDCAVDELITAIRTILRGKVYLSPDIMDVVVKDFLEIMREDEDSVYSILTQREREVLQLIAEGKTTREIADILNVSSKTVETHRQQIMKKLDLHNVAELTRYAIESGLVQLNK